MTQNNLRKSTSTESEIARRRSVETPTILRFRVGKLTKPNLLLCWLFMIIGMADMHYPMLKIQFL